MLIKKIQCFFNPERFQGWGKDKKYFEGWYFKVVDATERFAFAIIPGIAMDEEGNGHAFIQVLDGKNHSSTYHRFAIEEFITSSKEFKIAIGENIFSDQRIILKLPGINGELRFENRVAWPKPIYSPGIMGPYAFVPFMECYHGIVSMDHSIEGVLHVGDKIIDFNGGRGYIEKDWGRSFPSAYVWMQSNHFSTPGISVKASVANIPWIRNSFVGFIAGVWLGDRLIRFTTYNGSALVKLAISEKKLEMVLHSRKYIFELLATRGEATILASPIQGMMDGRIEESMTSILEVKITEKKSKLVILHDNGRNAGLEVAGEINQIIC